MSYGDSRAISLIVKSTAPNLNVYLWNRRRVSLLTPWRKWKRYAHIRIGYTRFISNSKKHEYSFIQDHNKYLVLVFVRLNFTLVIVKHKKKKKENSLWDFSCSAVRSHRFKYYFFFFLISLRSVAIYDRWIIEWIGSEEKMLFKYSENGLSFVLSNGSIRMHLKITLNARTILNAIFICEKIFSKVTLNSFTPK